MYYSNAHQSIIDRATGLTTRQKIMIEEKWDELVQENKLPDISRFYDGLLIPIIAELIRLSCIVPLILDVWSPNEIFETLSKTTGLALVLIWILFIIILPITTGLSLIDICSKSTTLKAYTELLMPRYIARLEKKSKFKAFYNLFFFISLLILLAMCGHIATAVCLFIASIISVIFSGASKNALLANIRREEALYFAVEKCT